MRQLTDELNEQREIIRLLNRQKYNLGKRLPEKKVTEIIALIWDNIDWWEGVNNEGWRK
ncbi:hypothetical protein KMP11_05030 [Gemella sp. zg-570]|uniref:hypothetical protein n=2 Tax=Gemella sp. zg-570 TaxID=2840371 RepID=UPI001C0B238D|nr:hypothetical protein [Gemella sp. zg-570]QWQ38327.1 hypothetical protein KMP11_05030 [Gemella sp. zg-570]